jgi:ribose transport system ATP-binding protein
MLELRGITKTYPGVKALDAVSLSFAKGEVHAIAGENGAGKSTLIKILSGAIRPDAGAVLLDGAELGPITPHQAIHLGISTIYQEFNLVPFLSVAENIFFGREPRRFGLLDKRRMHRMASQLCEDMGVQLDTRARVKDLGVAYQQIVEILKAVSRDARILIMDEPTAPLTSREIDVLFGIVEKVKQKAVTTIYISHRLEEIFRVCDRVSVLRDGRTVATSDTKATNRGELVALMVGRKLEEIYPSRSVRPGGEVLRVEDLRNKKLKGVSFALREREILGIGGLVGAGRTELARAIFGADPLRCGQSFVSGQPVQIRKPRDAIRLGIGLLPEDRKQHGVLLGMSVKRNISFPILKGLSVFGLLRKAREHGLCLELARRLNIKTPSLDQKAKNLSGGNQQKLVVAKWLGTRSGILIFDEPTRGIDVGAKREIYNLLNRFVEEGKSIIMISSEMPELMGMSDRILVMRNGAIAGSLEKAEFSQERTLMLASGIDPQVEGSARDAARDN